MRTYSTSVLAAAILALAACAPTGPQVPSQKTQPGLVALGTAEAFEVLTQAGFAKAEYFCAAGEFARDQLGAGNANRIEVIYARSPSQYRPGRLAMGFRLRGTNAQSGNVFFLGPRTGQVMSVGHANALCNATQSYRVSEDDDDD